MLGKNLTALLLSGFLSLVVFNLQAAETEKSYNQVNLSASASQEVGNDLTMAVLYSQHEGTHPDQLANTVNQAINAAIEQARAYPQIKLQTLDYTTRPIYRKQKIEGWRVRQSIHLQSSDTAAVSELIGQLQESLAVQSISYDISPKLRREAEDRLTVEAIAAFRQRALLIAKQFDRSTYRLVQLNIVSSGIEPRPMIRRARIEAQSLDSAPQLEAGTQKVKVVINGAIELQD